MQEKENKRLLYTAKDLQDITGFCPVKCREEIAEMPCLSVEFRRVLRINQ